MAGVVQVDSGLSLGFVAPGLEPVREQFDSFLAADPHFSAQFHVMCGDEVVIDLAGGAHLSGDSVTGVFSATKGVAAVALATLVDERALELHVPVAHYWPEFGAHGKSDLTVAELLSHQGGLVAPEDGLSGEDLFHPQETAARLAASRPFWRPGSAVGYHGLTIGVLMEELCRRVSGQTLQSLYEERVRAPRNIDFYLGLPIDQDHRFREVLPQRRPAGEPEPPQQTALHDSIASATFASFGEHAHDANVRSANLRRTRELSPCATGGIGSARGLAQVYATALGNLGKPLLSPDTIADVSQQQSWGKDRVLGGQACFGVVFQKPQPGRDFGSYKAFGHDGAGGALAFADPHYDTAFGYIPAPMAWPGGADPRALDLSRTLRECLLSRG